MNLLQRICWMWIIHSPDPDPLCLQPYDLVFELYFNRSCASDACVYSVPAAVAVQAKRYRQAWPQICGPGKETALAVTAAQRQLMIAYEQAREDVIKKRSQTNPGKATSKCITTNEGTRENMNSAQKKAIVVCNPVVMMGEERNLLKQGFRRRLSAVR